MEVPIQPTPAEIISEILSYLGKNDLLKCRLVSQSWNGLSLKILRNPKLEHEQELTQDNIKKFIKFSSERKEEWVLPFHLKFRSNVYSEESEDDDDDEETADYYDIPIYIQQLQTIFGEQCVVALTLSHESDSPPFPTLERLLAILTLIAPYLTHLDLSEFKLYCEGRSDIMNVKEMLGKTDLSFPNLSRLISCPAPILFHEIYREAKQKNELHPFLIENSQNLKELQVISPLDLSVLQTGILRKLKIVEALQQLDTFALPDLPVLSDLSLAYSTRLLDHQILIEFLSSFSKSLQSLTVQFKEIPANPFPRLDHLKFLRIHVLTPTRARILVGLEKLNLNSETFPVLESKDIQTNVYFESTDENSGSSKDDLSLRTVKNLRMRVTNAPFDHYELDEIEAEDRYEHTEIISRASVNDYVDHIQELFPNVTSLTLVNESGRHEEYLNQLLIAFIQSDGAPKIQELEIQNYDRNNLGQILNGLEDPDHQPVIIIKNMNLNEKCLKAIKKAFQEFSGVSGLSVDKELEFRDGAENRVITCKAPTPTNIHLKMTGLEKIKIHTNYSTKLNEDSGQLEIERDSNKKDLFLMSLPKHLPLLKQIDISQQMFGEDKDFCQQQIINVQNTFPDLIINTTP